MVEFLLNKKADIDAKTKVRVAGEEMALFDGGGERIWRVRQEEGCIRDWGAWGSRVACGMGGVSLCTLCEVWCTLCGVVLFFVVWVCGMLVCV